jgi:hypothetical protein
LNDFSFERSHCFGNKRCGIKIFKNYFHNIYVSKIIFHFSSHLTPNGLETLAKPCLLFKINIKIEKIHIVKKIDENVVMAEI